MRLRTRPPGVRPPAAPRPAASVRPRLVLLLAAACAVAVANIYYAQPLLDAMARELGVGSGTAGLVITASQLGYALGLVLLVPLGDLLDRRRLVGVLLLVCAAALVLVAGAPSFGVLAAAIMAVGGTSVVAQVLVPLAASLASDADRGRVVGHVMTGLLLGTLLSRTTAGLVAQVAGWRTVFLIAAALTAGLAALLFRVLPHAAPTTTARYPRLLRSVWDLMVHQPVLRRRSLYGALSFAAFNIVWTPVAFVLARPPYGYGEAVIGLFALLSVPLAFTTGYIGRLGDLGHRRMLTGVSFAVVVAAGAVGLLGTRALWALAAAALLGTLGSQAAHITNQGEIYRLDPAARSRITTAYMTSFFAGGVAGSALATTAYAVWGWTGVCGLLAGSGVAGLALWLRDSPRPSPPDPRPLSHDRDEVGTSPDPGGRKGAGTPTLS